MMNNTVNANDGDEIETRINGSFSEVVRYYINGREVSKDQADQQKIINDEIMAIEDLEEWLEAAKQIRFIVEV